MRPRGPVDSETSDPVSHLRAERRSELHEPIVEDSDGSRVVSAGESRMHVHGLDRRFR